MNQHKLNVLRTALYEMPKFFTSKQFGVKVRECGGDYTYGSTGAITKFLNDNAKKLVGQRWERRDMYSTTVKSESHEIIIPTETDEVKAINLLKQLGYKIYKTIEI